MTVQDGSIRSNLRKMYLFRFFANLHFIGGVLVPFFTDWGKISLSQTLILQSWFMLWIFFLEVPSGAFADKLGRKHSLALACVINTGAALIYGSLPNFFVFMLGEVLWAMSAALLSGASEAFIYDTLKTLDETEKSKKVFARIDSFGLAGVMVSAPIGSIIAANWGLNAPMLLLAIPTMAAFIIAMTLNELKTTRERELRGYNDILKGGVQYFYNSKVLKILAADMIFVATVAYFMIWFYQPMLAQAGVDIAYFGVIHASFVISQILIMNNYGRLERLLGSKKRLVTFSSLVTGVMFIIGGMTSFVPLVLTVIILGGGFGLSRRPLFVSYMNKHITSSERATVLSAISMIRRLSLMIVNPVVGFLADHSLSYTLVILGVLTVIYSIVSRVKEEHLID